MFLDVLTSILFLPLRLSVRDIILSYFNFSLLVFPCQETVFLVLLQRTTKDYLYCLIYRDVLFFFTHWNKNFNFGNSLILLPLDLSTKLYQTISKFWGDNWLYFAFFKASFRGESNSLPILFFASFRVKFRVFSRLSRLGSLLYHLPSREK